MRVRAIDELGDWTFGKGQNNYLVANAAIVQNIKTRLLSFLGDCFFDAGAGIDWFTFLGGKDQFSLTLAVKSVILNTEGVTGIKQTSVNLDSGTRQIFIQYSVITVYTSVSGIFQFDLNGAA